MMFGLISCRQRVDRRVVDERVVAIAPRKFLETNEKTKVAVMKFVYKCNNCARH
jgi:hypothetical protein